MVHGRDLARAIGKKPLFDDTVVGVGGLPVGLRWVGVAMLAGGLGLRAWAMRALGRFYTRTLRVVGDQQVVASGPYRLIRHPGYRPAPALRVLT